jgi:hypothetical protein
MTRQPYRRRSLSTGLRDENAPVGSIKPNGFGANQLGAHITAMVLDEAALMVVMSDNGEVYALDPNGLRATATISVHPEWICGTYTSRCGAGTIAGDLRVQARQMGRMAA